MSSHFRTYKVIEIIRLHITLLEHIWVEMHRFQEKDTEMGSRPFLFHLFLHSSTHQQQLVIALLYIDIQINKNKREINQKSKTKFSGV